MSSDRAKILSSISSALETLPQRAPYPHWEDQLPVSNKLDTSISLKELFLRNHLAASGRACESIDQLIQLLVAEGSSFGYCDPELASLFTDKVSIRFETEFDMAKVDEYTFGITRASAAIAESGTIVLKDTETSARLGALAPWIHVAVLKESDIVPSPAQAIERFGSDPSIIFCTGPSKTADIEGILIEGVHGPGIQVVLIV